MIPASWYSGPCVIHSPWVWAVPSNLLLTGYGRRDGISLPKSGYKNLAFAGLTLAAFLSLSLWLSVCLSVCLPCSPWRKPASLLWAVSCLKKWSTWQGTDVSGQQSEKNWILLTITWVSLEADPPLAEPSKETTSHGQCLDCSLVWDPEPEATNKARLRFLTHRHCEIINVVLAANLGIICFKAINN